MKRLGDSGKGMQFTSAKKGSQQDAPMPSKGDNPPGKPPNRTWAGFSSDSTSYNAGVKNPTWQPTRERQIAGGDKGREVNLAATYGRNPNDGSKPSPRKKAW